MESKVALEPHMKHTLLVSLYEMLKGADLGEIPCDNEKDDAMIEAIWRAAVAILQVEKEKV